MRKYLFPAFLLTVLLSACGKSAAPVPSPNEIWTAIQAEVPLSDMTDTGSDYLESLTGIHPEQCEQAICLLPAMGNAPDEIILVQAVGEDAAQNIQQQLEDRLDYKKRSVQQYLTEYQPIVANGVVRRDGLIVSLIVSPQIDKIIQIYDGLTK